MSLTDKLEKKCLILLDELKLAEVKTKKILEILNKLSSKEKSTLIVLPKLDRTIQKSAANLPDVEVLLANSLNVVDVLKYDYMLIPVGALKIIEKTYLK